MMKRSGLKPPVVETKRIRSTSVTTTTTRTTDLYKPTASSLARSRGNNGIPALVPPKPPIPNIARPVTRARSQSAAKPETRPTTAFGSRLPGKADNKAVVTLRLPGKENNVVKPKNFTKAEDSALGRSEFGEFKSVSALDFNRVSRINSGLSRPSIMATNFMDPVERKALQELMKQDFKQRYSVDFAKSMVERNPALETNTTIRSMLREEKHSVLDRTEGTGHESKVKFAENPTVCRISEESTTTPTSSKNFMDRVRNTPSILRTPIQQPMRPSLPYSSTPNNRAMPKPFHHRLSEKEEEEEEEESPPEPTPPPSFRQPAVQIKIESPSEETKEDTKAVFYKLFNSFTTCCKSLTLEELQSIQKEIDLTSLDTIKACIKMISP